MLHLTFCHYHLILYAISEHNRIVFLNSDYPGVRTSPSAFFSGSMDVRVMKSTDVPVCTP